MKYLLALSMMFAGSYVIAEDNIVILLDTSGSMESRMKDSRLDRMHAAQDALVTVIEQLPDTTKIGVMTFQGWIYPLGDMNKPLITKAIKSTRSDGGTPLGRFMKSATDALLFAREKNKNYGTYKLLVVTDGEASDNDLFNKYLPDIASRGITLDSIGVGMESDHPLSKNSRHYMRADNPQSLTQAVNSSLAEVTQKGDGLAEFSELNGLDNDVAKAIIICVTDQANNPIGEERVIKVTDPKGNMVQIPIAGIEDKKFPTWGWICVTLLLILILFIIIAIANR